MKESTLWEIAYQEIRESEDAETQKLLQAYDVLLERAAEERLKDTDDPASGDGGEDSNMLELQPNSENLDSDDKAQDGSDIDVALKSRFGVEQEMKSIATANLEKMRQKEWIVKWGGKELFKVRDQVTKIVNIVEKFSGLVSKAAALDPMHAGLAWAGICVVLPVNLKNLNFPSSLKA
jgi:NWD NACHT NTPase-like protein